MSASRSFRKSLVSFASPGSLLLQLRLKKQSWMQELLVSEQQFWTRWSIFGPLNLWFRGPFSCGQSVHQFGHEAHAWITKSDRICRGKNCMHIWHSFIAELPPTPLLEKLAKELRARLVIFHPDTTTSFPPFLPVVLDPRLNSPLPDSHSVVRHEITLQGLHLFNMDMIREHGTEDVYYVIDINYFPGKWNSSRVGFSSPIRSLIRAVSFVSFTSTQATGRCPITSMYSPTFCRASGATRRDLQLNRKNASQSRGLRIQSPRGYGWPGGLNYLVSQANKYEFDTRYWPWIDIPFCWWTSCCRRRVHWQPPQFSSCS